MSGLERIRICTLLCAGAFGTAAAAPTPPDWVRWFTDDFEDGTARRWRIWDLEGRDAGSSPGAWRVEQDGGNNVFVVRQEFFARPKTVRGSDYRLKARVKVIRGRLQVAVRHDCVCYFVGMTPNSLYLMRTRPCGVHTTLNSVGAVHEPGRWYVLEIVSIGPDVKVYVDDALKISYSDPQPVPFGGVMLWTYGDSYAQVDDIEITGPPATTSGPQVADLILPVGVVGTPYLHTLTASGGTPPYKWSLPAGTSLAEGLSLKEDGTISGTPAKKEGYQVAVMVTDAEGRRAVEGLRMEVEEAAITTGATLPAGEVGRPYSLRFEVAGMPGGCQWVAPELPPGMALHPVSGVLSGTPALGGTYQILVACLSGATDVTKLFGFYAAEPNPRPLAIATQPDQLLGVELTGKTTAVQIAASGGIPPYSWAVTSGELPPGTRLLAGRLLADQVSPFHAAVGGYPMSAGKYRFTIQASDSAGAAASQEFELQATWINVGGDRNYDEVMLLTLGAPFSAQLFAQGGIAPYRWAPLSLPAGLELAPGGQLSGVPAECGVFPGLAQVTDSDNPPVTHRFGGDFTFIILCAKDSFSLVNIHAPAKITGAKVNEPFEYPIGLANGTGKGYRCSLSGGRLPGGLALAEGKLPGIAVISGTPAEAGTFEFELRATDDGGSIGVRKLKLVVQ